MPFEQTDRFVRHPARFTDEREVLVHELVSRVRDVPQLFSVFHASREPIQVNSSAVVEYDPIIRLQARINVALGAVHGRVGRRDVLHVALNQVVRVLNVQEIASSDRQGPGRARAASKFAFSLAQVPFLEADAEGEGERPRNRHAEGFRSRQEVAVRARTGADADCGLISGSMPVYASLIQSFRFRPRHGDSGGAQTETVDHATRHPVRQGQLHATERSRRR